MTPERLKLFIHHNPNRIFTIPNEKYITQDLWRDTANINMAVLKKLPMHFRNIEFIRSLDYSRPRMLEFAQRIVDIPLDDLKDIIRANGKHIQYVSDKLQTPELCKIAIDNYPLAIFYINTLSSDQINNQIQKLLKDDPMNFFKIPQSYQTVELFHTMEKNLELLNYINNMGIFLKDEFTLEEKIRVNMIQYDIKKVYNDIQNIINIQHKVISNENKVKLHSNDNI